jgi:nitroimidazol reductase NimA-like FMN-containing flavoprotein (pyridoxamine 5'-phosphate oxidase superfamily)
VHHQQLINELQQPGARDLLQSSPLLRLAYTGIDGFPRVIPIGFLWTKRFVVVCTAPTSPKVEALAARPEVAVTIDTGHSPSDARALLVRGTATLETVDGVPDEYLAAAGKTMAPDSATAFEDAVRAMYTQMVRISIEPTWARFYDFGAGRMPRFLHDLAEKAADPESR